MKTKKYKTAAHKRMYGIEEGLREYFATHEDIHVRELARIGHFAVSTAYRKLKAYVEQGKLALVPKSSHYYRWVGE